MITRKKLCFGIFLVMLLPLTACGKTSTASQVSTVYPQNNGWQMGQRRGQGHWQNHDRSYEHHNYERGGHKHSCSNY